MAQMITNNQAILFIFLVSQYTTIPMEQPKEASSNTNPLFFASQTYYELSSLELELDYLNTCMKRMHNQHNLIDPIFSFQEETNNNTFSIFYFNVQKKENSLTRNLVESQVTLHAFSCKDPNEYCSIIEKIKTIYSLSRTIVKNQITALKNKESNLSYMEDFALFFKPYAALKEAIASQKNYWLSENRYYETRNKICSNFNEPLVREKILTNEFGHEAISALPNPLIISYEKELTKCVFQSTIQSNTKEAIIKRFAQLYKTENGKLINPSRDQTLLENKIGQHAFKNTLEPKLIILILEQSRQIWLKKNKNAFKQTIEELTESIKKEYADSPTKALPIEAKQLLARILNLNIRLSQVS